MKQAQLDFLPEGAAAEGLLNDSEYSGLLGAQFDSLPPECRAYLGETLSWRDILSRGLDVDKVMHSAQSLLVPRMDRIDNSGRLILLGGHLEPLASTFGLNYFQSRALASQAECRGIITLEEYMRKGPGLYPTWVESGEDPSHASIAFAINGRLVQVEIPAKKRWRFLGAHFAVRVPMVMS